MKHDLLVLWKLHHLNYFLKCLWQTNYIIYEIYTSYFYTLWYLSICKYLLTRQSLFTGPIPPSRVHCTAGLVISQRTLMLSKVRCGQFLDGCHQEWHFTVKLCYSSDDTFNSTIKCIIWAIYLPTAGTYVPAKYYSRRPSGGLITGLQLLP